MGLSNNLVGIWNIVTMILSLPIIGAGIWLATKHDTICIRFLQWPVIILGVVLLVISILGFIGSCWRVSCLLWVYLAVMFLLILLLIVFTIFAFVVTNKGAGQALSGKGYKDYRLGDYSTWLQRQVDRSSTWSKIQSCLSDAKVCNHLDDDYPTLQQFNAAKLTPLESGCCKPPTSCGFTFINATDWDTSTGSGTDSDCQTWSNDAKALCFNCNSCKAGVLQNIKQDWRTVGIILICTLVLLIAVYSIGCCAFRNARRSGPSRRGYAKNGFA
ncbi:unnamed protein product [Calypogeia fissa]